MCSKPKAKIKKQNPQKTVDNEPFFEIIKRQNTVVTLNAIATYHLTPINAKVQFYLFFYLTNKWSPQIITY